MKFHLKKIPGTVLAAMLLTLFSAAAAEPVNLMPDGTADGKAETPGIWHCTPYNGAVNQVQYTSQAETRTLNVSRSGAAGYSAWRLYLLLEPGDYTLETELNGTGHGGIDVYAFDANKKPAGALALLDFPAGQPRPVKVLQHFTVKEGTASVRFGFTCRDTGNLAFRFPRLFKGRLAAEQLPPQPVAETVKQAAPAGAEVPVNLMPDGTADGKAETPGIWHCTPYNGAVNQVDYVSRVEKRTLEINRSGAAGYSAWRLYLLLEPGDYTLETELNGTGCGGIDVYAFDAAKKPIKALALLDFPAGQPRPVKVLQHFTVKEGTASVRFGFTCRDTGNLAFRFPRLFKGRLAAEQLPPQPVAVAAESKAVDVLREVKEFHQVNNGSGTVTIIDPTTGIATALTGGKMAQNARAEHIGNGWRFFISNRPVDVARVTYQAEIPPMEVTAGSYVEIVLKASGIHYSKASYPVLSLGDMVLLTSSEIYSDQQCHRVLFRVPENCRFHTLTANLRTDAAELNVELLALRTLSDLTLLPVPAAANAPADPGIEYVDLTQFHRSILADELESQIQRVTKVYDAVQLPAQGEIELDGARFQITGERTLIKGTDLLTRPPEMNGLRADGLHPKTPWEKACDAAVILPLSGKAQELWLLLNARMTPFVQRNAPPAMPPQFATHEVLDVEIVYADGQIDHSYPYSLADRGFSVQRFLGAYAVALDPQRELSKVIIHNYFRGGNGGTALAAATLNRSAAPLIPQEVRDPEPYAVKALTAIPESPLKVTHTQKALTLENGAYRLTMQLGKAFAITGFAQKLNPEAPLAIGRSGLEIDVAGKLLTGNDFEVRNVKTDANGAEILLHCKDAAVPLDVVLSVRGSQSSEILFNAVLRNCGTERLSARVRFPVLNQVTMGDPADNWIYFPKYCTQMSNKITYALCPGDERAYFVQFFDGFNPKAGYGLALITHNFDGTVLDYGLFKEKDGLKYFIQYPAPWHPLLPGKDEKLVETALVLHTGDWHGGLQAYRNWVKSWFRPLKSGKLDWWKNTWVVSGQLLTKPYGWTIPTYDEAAKKFLMLEQLQVVRDRWDGETPLTHVWGWNMPAALYPGEKPRTGTPNSNYADGEFDPANYRGGAQALVAEFRKLQAAGSPVSLYTIPAYLPKACPVGRSRGKELTQIRADGSMIEDDQCYFPCSWAWRDTFVAACTRAQKATGCNAVYIDISPFPRDYTCYSPNHGHTVPLNTNVSSRRILKAMREALPEGVALWHEDPACDVDVQYSSGCFTYYAGRTWAHRAPNYGETTNAPLIMPAKQSILRFVFPHYKMFIIPVGYDSGKVEMDQYTIHFFNGDSINDATFGIYNDRTIAVVRKIAKLQRLHSKTFLALQPQPLVPTLAGGVEANLFPADDGSESIWTFWNGRYSTFRGEVLEVETLPGERWRDLWNDCDLPVTHRNGKTVISMELQPQMVGCIARITEQLPQTPEQK